MTVAIKSERQSVTPQKRTRRKEDKNRFGTLRNIKGKIYFSFKYLEIWVKAFSNLDWNDDNLELARHQLDKIGLAIRDGTFRFKKVFPKHRKADFFSELERKFLNRTYEPTELTIRDYAERWFEMIGATGRRTDRTMLSHRSILNHYILPFFGDFTFAEVNPAVLEDYVVWAKKLKLRQKKASNSTINKSLNPLRMMCKDAAIRYGWGATFNPFFGYKKLPEKDTNYEINPFSMKEQKAILDNLDVHWKPYFTVAFRTGMRQGEQVALLIDDVDFDRMELYIRRALTLDRNGKPTMGTTKNSFSRRTIKLLPDVFEAIQTQVEVSNSLGSKYLFCSSNGCRVHPDNLRGRIWAPTLEAANVSYRPMIQTRHSFATTALSVGESPLWIAKTMGHSTSKMVIEVYGKYVQNANGTMDGSRLTALYKDESK